MIGPGLAGRDRVGELENMAYDPDALAKLVAKIDRLPALPEVLIELLDMVADEGSSASDLERIIANDPALTARVLSLANSAMFGFSQRVTTVRRAVVAIGFGELKMMALGSGLADFFEAARTPLVMDLHSLWAHAIGVSVTAREIARSTGRLSPGEMQVAGLIHDLGKLALFSHLHQDTEGLIRLIAGGRPYYQAEAELGLEHARLGGLLAEQWRLPTLYRAIIAGHHAPDPAEPDYEAVCLIHLADLTVKSLLKFGVIHESAPLDMGPIFKALDLSASDVLLIAEKVHRLYFPTWEAFESMMNLKVGRGNRNGVVV